MRKRSKYRPKPVFVDPVAWVVNGFKPMATHESAIDLKIKNHQALKDMSQGIGNKDQFDVLVASMNMAEALAIINPGKLGGDVREEIQQAQNALHSLGKRFLEYKRFVFKAQELDAMNIGMEIHDLQLDICTIQELEKALDLVAKVIRHKQARTIA